MVFCRPRGLCKKRRKAGGKGELSLRYVKVDTSDLLAVFQSASTRYCAD